MKINKSYLIAGLALLAIVVWFLIHSFKPEKFDNQQPAAAVKETVLPSVVYRDAVAVIHPRTFALYGRTEASREVNVKAQTVGQIVSTPATEGARVNAGALLCRQDVDARQSVLDQAQAGLRSVELDLKAARILADKGYQSATRVTAIEAQLDGARAAVTQAQIELDNVNIRAPFSGMWERQTAELGDYLAPGQACGLLVDLSPLIVRVDLSETQISEIKVGRSAQIKLATGQSLDGKVRLIESKANQMTRTFSAEIAVPNPDMSLKAGVTADVRLTAGQGLAQQIPSQILTLDDNGIVGVRYLNSDDTVAFSPVVTVDEDDGGIWVTGLPDRTRIIIKGQDYVAPGTKVRPVTEREADSRAKDAP